MQPAPADTGGNTQMCPALPLTLGIRFRTRASLPATVRAKWYIQTCEGLNGIDIDPSCAHG